MQSHPARFAVVVVLVLSLPLLVGGASGDTLDHLKCYRVRDVTERASYSVAIATRNPADFPTDVGCTIRTPASLLCVAARQIVISPATAGGVAGQPSQDYLCYKMKCPPNRPTLTLTDQFGSHPLRVTRSNLYCTPACSGCNGACTNLQNDAANCGTCGNACAPGVACTAGSCEGTIPTTSSTSPTSTSTSTSTTSTSTGSATTSTSTTSTSTTSTTTLAGASCQVEGVSHTITFDGLRFDVQAPGVFSLVESDALSVQLNSGPLGIEGRTIYVAIGVALRYGTTVLVYDTVHGLVMSGDGQGVIVQQSGVGGEVGYSAHVLLADGSGLKVTVVGVTAAGPGWLNIEVDEPGTTRAEVRGLCGNFDGNNANDNVAPDGQAVPLTAPVISLPNGTDLALTWVPDDAANLFLAH